MKENSVTIEVVEAAENMNDMAFFITYFEDHMDEKIELIFKRIETPDGMMWTFIVTNEGFLFDRNKYVQDLENIHHVIAPYLRDHYNYQPVPVLVEHADVVFNYPVICQFLDNSAS